MKQYIVKRIIQAIFVMIASATLVFFVVRITGDPVALILPPEASHEDYERLTIAMGLDKPLLIQYKDYMLNIIKGDFGQSFWHKRPALEIILERYPATLQLATCAMVLSLLIAIPLGLVSAMYKGSWLDQLAMTGAVFGHAMPTFWLGIMLIAVFAVHFQILPSFGRGSIEHLILPTVTLAAYSIARLSRLTRSNMLEVLNADYIRTAHSKGLSTRKVILKHAFRNAMIPILTLAALEYGLMLGGAVITETIFAWPGLGWLAIEAISRRDFPLVQAVVLSVAWVFVLINLITDILYGFVDPRIKIR
jgi:peptide/nickel transport system permease protein